jgi:hypothetical protein
MNQKFLSSIPVVVNAPHDDVSSYGISRRSFLKRSGGATVAALVTWGALQNQIKAEDSDPNASTLPWGGSGTYEFNPSEFKDALAEQVGLSLTNSIMIALSNNPSGMLANLAAKLNGSPEERRELVDVAVKLMLKGYFFTQTIPLHWTINAGATEYVKEKMLKEPSLGSNTPNPSSTIGLELDIAGAKFGMSGTITYQLNLDNPHFVEAEMVSTNVTVNGVPTTQHQEKEVRKSQIPVPADVIDESTFQSYGSTKVYADASVSPLFIASAGLLASVGGTFGGTIKRNRAECPITRQ